MQLDQSLRYQQQQFFLSLKIFAPRKTKIALMEEKKKYEILRKSTKQIKVCESLIAGVFGGQ